MGARACRRDESRAAAPRPPAEFVPVDGTGSHVGLPLRSVRERKVLPLEAAIHRMTALPARRVGLHDRGTVAPGMRADLVAFDLDIVADRATFERPHQYPVGVPHVWVNGVPVIRDGEHTGARPGRSARPARR